MSDRLKHFAQSFHFDSLGTSTLPSEEFEQCSGGILASCLEQEESLRLDDGKCYTTDNKMSTILISPGSAFNTFHPLLPALGVPTPHRIFKPNGWDLTLSLLLFRFHLYNRRGRDGNSRTHNGNIRRRQRFGQLLEGVRCSRIHSSPGMSYRGSSTASIQDGKYNWMGRSFFSSHMSCRVEAFQFKRCRMWVNGDTLHLGAVRHIIRRNPSMQAPQKNSLQPLVQMARSLRLVRLSVDDCLSYCTGRARERQMPPSSEHSMLLIRAVQIRSQQAITMRLEWLFKGD